MLLFAVPIDSYFGDENSYPDLTIDDIAEMIELYNYYRHSDYPLSYDDLAFMFNCSVNNIKKVFRGTHPAQTEQRALRRAERRWEGKDWGGTEQSEVTTPIIPSPVRFDARGRKRLTHCSAGHELTDDNLYVDKHGKTTRKCLTCYQQARAAAKAQREARKRGNNP